MFGLIPLHKILALFSFFDLFLVLCVSWQCLFLVWIKIQKLNSSLKIVFFWKFSSCHLPREVSRKKLFFQTADLAIVYFSLNSVTLYNHKNIYLAWMKCLCHPEEKLYKNSNLRWKVFVKFIRKINLWLTPCDFKIPTWKIYDPGSSKQGQTLCICSVQSA